MNKGKHIRGILLFGLITVVSVCLLYYISGAPSFSPEMAMHRKEARALVGPSHVIAGAATGHNQYDSFLLGETEYGYCLYEYNDGFSLWDGGLLSYIEKADGVTVFPVGTSYMWYGGVPGELGFIFPVFAIQETTRAVSARLTLTAEYDGVSYSVSETASLEQTAYFLFMPKVDEVHSYVRDFWYRRLSGKPMVYPGVSGTATLELFDRQGELIETIVMEFPATM